MVITPDMGSISPLESDESSNFTLTSLSSDFSGSEDRTSDLESEFSYLDNYVKVVTREEWGAKPSRKQFLPVKLPVRNVWFVFNTDSDPCTTNEECRESMRDFQRRMQVESNLSDIPFNFLVGGDGKVYEARGWNGSAPDVQSFPICNRRRIEIGYIGRFHRRDIPLKIITKAYDFVSFGLKEEYLVKCFDIKEWARVGVPYVRDPEPQYVSRRSARRAPPQRRRQPQPDSDSSGSDDKPSPTTFDYIKHFDDGLT